MSIVLASCVVLAAASSVSAASSIAVRGVIAATDAVCTMVATSVRCAVRRKQRPTSDASTQTQTGGV